jgi:hypothetical protein
MQQNWFASSILSFTEVIQRQMRWDDGYACENNVELSRVSFVELFWHLPERIESSKKSAGEIILTFTINLSRSESYDLRITV